MDSKAVTGTTTARGIKGLANRAIPWCLWYAIDNPKARSRSALAQRTENGGHRGEDTQGRGSQTDSRPGKATSFTFGRSSPSFTATYDFFDSCPLFISSSRSTSSHSTVMNLSSTGL